MSEEFAYKLLAWLHHHGNHEAVVFNTDLVSDLLIAQNMFKIRPGEQMEPEVVIKLQDYMRQGKDAPFMKDIFKKYNLKRMH